MSPKTVIAANNGWNCASPNFLQKIEIKLLTKLADKLGKTVGIGLGGSVGAGLGGPGKLVGMYGSGSAQLMVSPGGTANLAYSYGGTLLTGNPLTIVYGAGGLFGLQASVSNSPPANGYSLDASGGGGYRYGGGLDASVSLDDNTLTNPSWTLTGTGGLAFGGYGGAGAIVKTVVVPICKN